MRKATTSATTLSTLHESPQGEATVSAELEKQIRYRAFELYELRGKVEGYDLQDWLQAQAELQSETEGIAA